MVQKEPSWISFCPLPCSSDLRHTWVEKGLWLWSPGSSKLGRILISAPAYPLQLSWASLISSLTAWIPLPGLLSLRVAQLPKHFILYHTLYCFLRGLLWKPGLQCNCWSCYWNSFWVSLPWAESSESSHGERAGFASCRLGLPGQIPKASFLCGLFQNLLNVPGDRFLDKFFSLAWSQARKEQNRC